LKMSAHAPTFYNVLGCDEMPHFAQAVEHRFELVGRR